MGSDASFAGRGKRMFRIIFRKELLESVQNYRFLIALLMCGTIIPTSMYFSATDYRAQSISYMEAIRLYEESHKTIGDSIRLGAAAFCPPSSLAMLSAGGNTCFRIQSSASVTFLDSAFKRNSGTGRSSTVLSSSFMDIWI